MAVLIEAVTLVVRRLSAEIGYPGGADAFLQATLELEQPPRYVCDGDELLLNLSFYDRDHVAPAAALLQNAGLIDVDDDTEEFLDFAYVDQVTGPTMPCSWLEWKKQPDGFTIAWDTSGEIGELAAPLDWTPQQSRDLSRTDVRDDDKRFFRLATEDGFDTYLDLTTGEISKALSRSLPEEEPSMSRESAGPQSENSASTSEDDSVANRTLFRSIEHAFVKLGWHPTRMKDPVAVVEVTGNLAIYRCRYAVLEAPFVISCVTRAPLIVPEQARGRVMEFITRANVGMNIGAWTLCVYEGILAVRSSLNVEDSIATPAMIENLARIGIGTLDRFYPGVLDLIAGRMSVLDALKETED